MSEKNWNDIHTFDYDLDPSLIAQMPLAQRSDSRLLVLDRQFGGIRHSHFLKIGEQLRSGDVLVVNDSRVWKARFFGRRDPGGGRVEGFLLRLGSDHAECLLRPAKRIRPNDRIQLADGSHLLVLGRISENEGSFQVKRLSETSEKSTTSDAPAWSDFLDLHGEVPLPPYIKNPLSNLDRYQTVYAGETGSSAAPTAGLHFTPDILVGLASKGIETVRVTLHVGLGTFLPFYGEDLSKEQLHSEEYQISESVANTLGRAKLEKRRIVAVVPTALRAIESNFRKFGEFRAFRGSTRLFVRPPEAISSADALLTNFHLPKSSLLMLVTAFGGFENVMAAYRAAVLERYRFFSFGDAMLIA